MFPVFFSGLEPLLLLPVLREGENPNSVLFTCPAAAA
jgi:hypothetical protein